MFSMLQMLIEYCAMRCRLKAPSRGATMVEYALIVAVIALVLIVAGTTIGDAVNDVFAEAKEQLQDAA